MPAYSGLHDPSLWTFAHALREHAQRMPARQWLACTTGERLTFAQAEEDCARMAGFLAAQGVAAGDRVVVMLPTGVDFIRVWLGLALLGATAVLLNTELRGNFLKHQVQTARPRLMVVEETLLEALAGTNPEMLDAPNLLVASDAATTRGARWREWSVTPRWDGPLPDAQSIACIMYTSGTSGPSKATLLPHAHCVLFGIGQMEAFGIDDSDVMYVALPLYHANGLFMCVGSSLLAGIPVVLRPRFSASAWLPDIREHGVTVTNLLGALGSFVLGTPPSPRDRDHRLRAICNGPNRVDHEAMFKERFGLKDVIAAYGMTEINIVAWGRAGKPVPGAIGWVQQGRFDIMVADPETDVPRAPGEVGEIMVRPNVPGAFMAGYFGMPDKTIEAWRGLWFHSGDAGTLSADGLLVFIDRLKDCIRRRGHNISPSEVEEGLAGLPGVAELSAYPVPSGIAGGEDEIMIALVAAEGAPRTAYEVLAEHADRALPKFAQPRYFRFFDQLPKTGTGKVQRAELRKLGTADAWDRDAAQGQAR